MESIAFWTPILVCALNLIFGTVFSLGIIHFEKYGEDPLKRPLVNKVCIIPTSNYIYEVKTFKFLKNPPILYRLLQMLFVVLHY